MYRVTMINDSTETVISATDTSSLKLGSGTIKRKLNAIDSFTFTINPSNPAWGNIYPMHTIITVKDVRSGITEFRGRVINPGGSMAEDGKFQQTIECESLIAYLHDSVQRYDELHNISASDFLRIMLDRHNAQVDSSKRIQIGICNVTDSNDSLYRYLTYESTWDSIQDRLVNRLGGYLFLRNDSAPFFLDYLTESGERREMGIDLTKNLLAIEKQWQVNEVITRLIPLGAEVESVPMAIKRLVTTGVIDSTHVDYWTGVYGSLPFLGQLLINLSKLAYLSSGGSGFSNTADAIAQLAAAGAISSPDYWNANYTAISGLSTLLITAAGKLDTSAESTPYADAGKPRLTIESVNGGNDYLIDTNLADQYGIIEGTRKWDDITLASNLKAKGEEWMANQRGAESITLTALRLHLLNENYEDFKIGNYYKPNNQVLGISNEYYQVTERSINIFEPQRSDLTFGNRPLTLSGYAAFSGGRG